MNPTSQHDAPANAGSSFAFGSRTDVGCVRDNNEDSLLVTPPVFAVADGMGGHAAGEVASEIAIHTLASAQLEHPNAAALSDAVCAANQAILDGVRTGAGREGMGTTLTAAIIEGERLVIAQVGDSRAYLASEGRMHQLTRDHSLMAEMIESGQLTPEEARVHPQRSVITRALGSAPNTKPDIYELNVESGDRLLLCSDGLSSLVPDEAIERMLLSTPNPQQAADELVEEARARGGFDNITTIVVDITGFAPARERKAAKRGKAIAIVVACLLVGAIAAAVAGFNAWVSTAAYLADNNGTVAVYQGVPGTLLGQEFHHLAATSDVPTDKLNAGLAARLKEKGVTADTVESATTLLEHYAEELDMKDAGIKQAP